MFSYTANFLFLGQIVLGWLVPWAVKEFTKRRKCREQCFYSLFQERKGTWCREIYQLQMVGAVSFYWVIKGEGDASR